jgi:hypothetical protein
MGIDLKQLEAKYEEFTFPKSYRHRDHVKTELLEMLFEYDESEEYCYNKLTGSKPLLDSNVFLYLVQLRGEKYLEEFGKYFTYNSEGLVEAAYESLVEKFRRDPVLFERACEHILHSNRLMSSNLACVFMFQRLERENADYPNMLLPNANMLRKQLRHFGFPGVSLDSSW